MLKIIISGCSGHMGHNVARLAAEAEDISVVAGFDVCSSGEEKFPV